MLAEGSLPGDRTLADVVMHLRYHACRARQLTIHLAENGYGPGGVGGRGETGWCLYLHGEVGYESGHARSDVGDPRDI